MKKKNNKNDNWIEVATLHWKWEIAMIDFKAWYDIKRFQKKDFSFFQRKENCHPRRAIESHSWKCEWNFEFDDESLQSNLITNNCAISLNTEFSSIFQPFNNLEAWMEWSIPIVNDLSFEWMNEKQVFKWFNKVFPN